MSNKYKDFKTVRSGRISSYGSSRVEKVTNEEAGQSSTADKVSSFQLNKNLITSKRDASRREGVSITPRYDTRSHSTSLLSYTTQNKKEDQREELNSLEQNDDFHLAEQSPSKSDAAEDAYNFTATAETPPSDGCMARGCFSPPVHQTAEEYALMKERRRLRQIECDLLMGMLGTANQDEIISVADIAAFTESRISSFGISKVIFQTDEKDVVIKTEGVLSIEEKFPISEVVTSETTLILNGKVAPHVSPTIGIDEHDIPWNSGVLQDAGCSLCESEDSRYQFQLRHSKENLRHLIAHEHDIKGCGLHCKDQGRIIETTFTAEADLVQANYDRQYNFPPTASHMEEAVKIVSEDDHIPSTYLLTDYEVILSGIECISGLAVVKLLKFFYILKNVSYSPVGKTIRHVQMCRGNIPASFLSRGDIPASTISFLSRDDIPASTTVT